MFFIFSVSLFFLILLLSVCYYKKYSTWVYLQLLFFAMLVWIPTYIMETNSRKDHKDKLKNQLIEDLGNLRTRIEISFNSDIVLIHGLSSFVSTNPHMTEEQFERYASALFTQNAHIINFGVAPNLVIKFIYPLKGNEKAMGLDYNKVPAQREAALLAKERRKIVVAGPVKLMQGGEAFIARKATYYVDNAGVEQFWGLVSAPIDLRAVFDDAGLYDFSKKYQVALRGKDASGPEGEIFFGSYQVYAVENAQMEIKLPYGSWGIAAAPLMGWSETDAPNLFYWLVGWAIYLLFSMLTLSAAKTQRAKIKSILKLNETQEQTQIMFENSPIGMCLCDNEMKVKDYNPSFAQILHINQLNLDNLKITDLLKNKKEDIFQGLQDKLARSSSVEFDQIEVSNPNSPQFLNVVVLTPKKRIKGNQIWFFIEDVTSQVQYEKSLQTEKEKALKAQEMAEIAASAKGAFLATMSHEIRTPINGVLASAELLSHEDLPTQQRELVDIINRSGNFLLEIINDILDLSKLEEGKMSIEKIDVNLSELCQRFSKSFLPMAEEKGIEFFTDVHQEFSQKNIISDPTRISQLISNLCSNAVKFTSKGNVKLIVQMKDNSLIIKVSDTGIGMSKESVQKIFAPFTQVDASVSRKFGGTGLGLSICKSLVDLLGGQIQVNSEEGVGSTFMISLPLVWGKDISKDSSGIGVETRSYQRKVLLVDDNAINTVVAAKLLEKLGLIVIKASDGKDALNKMNDEIELVFMDINMPVMNGIECFKEMRKRGIKVPIIALTANVIAEDVNSYLQTGFNQVLGKPFKYTDLILLLDQYFIS